MSVKLTYNIEPTDIVKDKIFLDKIKFLYQSINASCKEDIFKYGFDTKKRLLKESNLQNVN